MENENTELRNNLQSNSNNLHSQIGFLKGKLNLVYSFLEITDTIKDKKGVDDLF
jgi:hypothetical protein